VTLSANTTGTALTCSATNNAGLSNSASVTIEIDKTAPVIVPTVSGATEVSGWYGGDVSVSWSVADGESGILSSSGCTVTNLTGETTGTTLTCSATNNAGLSSSASLTLRIDKTGPVISGSNVTTEATGPAGSAVSYSVSAVDAVDGPVSVSCSPVSGAMFPVGATTVTCSASDLRGNRSNASLRITVSDRTAPSIEHLPDILGSAHHRFGKRVFYPSPTTLDLVDGAGVATCSPASGSYFPIGNTRVTCIATDAHGNRATSTFIVQIEYEPVRPTPAPSGPPTIIIPETNDDLIELDTESIFWAFGIRFSFINLGDQQAAIREVTAKDLPAKLPDGFSLVMGVNVDVLTDGKLLKELPPGSSLKMDFPMAGGAKDQFAVLYWNGSEWVKLVGQNGGSQLPRILSLTTDKAGIFVLVKK
jgi:hypothetical protein